MYLVSSIAIAAAALVLINVRWTQKRRDYVRPHKPKLQYSAVRIVCGDCAGGGISPVKTFMDRHGRCDRCGGASYFLASDRGLFLKSAMAQGGRRLLTDDSPIGPTAETTPRLEAVPLMRIAV